MKLSFVHSSDQPHVVSLGDLLKCMDLLVFRAHPSSRELSEDEFGRKETWLYILRQIASFMPGCVSLLREKLSDKGFYVVLASWNPEWIAEWEE